MMKKGNRFRPWQTGVSQMLRRRTGKRGGTSQIFSGDDCYGNLYQAGNDNRDVQKGV
jgi:hypothetical protein